MSTKFKIFTGAAPELENALNEWVAAKEKTGTFLIAEVHFAADSKYEWSVFVKYSEWENSDK